MRIAAVFNYKIKKGLAGRRQSCKIVKSKFAPADKVIWMHAASLGEYEQGLPVLEKLKENFPSYKILVTFFSPSGYDHVIKRTTIADAVCYLPFDTENWIEDFTSNFKTEIFFTVKYEYWYHLLRNLKNQNAKIFVVSALFYETQLFFKFYGKWFVHQLKEDVDWFFHQTNHSSALAKGIGIKNSSTSGDTRFDRVKQNTQRDNSVPFIEEFIQDRKVVVIGSSWQAEERLAEMLVSKNRKVKFIIAPHDLKRVLHLKTIFPEAILYSEIENNQNKNDFGAQILIIDCIGLLSKLYAYGDIAIVGGGFHSKGLHNILEAAIFGIPVFFGKEYRNNPEADDLISQNGAKSFEDEFFAAPYISGLLINDDLRKKMGFNAKNYIETQPDSAAIVVKQILKIY